MKTLYVGLHGGPGCGKSVMMADLFSAIKKAGHTCEMVTEYAKELVWAGRLDKLDNQHEVARAQYEMLKARQGKTRFVVTDGPLSNSLYYNRHHPHVCDIEKTEQVVLKWLGEFESFNLFLCRGEFRYEQDGRYQSEAEAKAMDAPILEALSAHIPLHKVAPNPDHKALARYIIDVAEGRAATYPFL